LATSFYLLFFSYMLYNSKWFEIFQACSQLKLKHESKEAPPTWIFFHTNMSLWSAAWPIFCKAKKRILANSNANILQSTPWKFLKFFPHLFKLVFYKILWLYTLTAKTKYKVWMLSFQQPYHEHQWIKSKSVNTKVVVCNILHTTT